MAPARSVHFHEYQNPPGAHPAHFLHPQHPEAVGSSVCTKFPELQRESTALYAKQTRLIRPRRSACVKYNCLGLEKTYTMIFGELAAILLVRDR